MISFFYHFSCNKERSCFLLTTFCFICKLYLKQCKHKNQHFLDKEFTGLVLWVNLGLPFEGFSEHVPNFV